MNMQPSPIAFDDWRSRASAFTWRGHKVSYHQMGAGPNLLLLHGFPGSSWDWSWVADTLKNHFNVIIPDMLDAGSSRNPMGRSVSFFDQTEMISALMTQLELPHCHIVAHGSGVMVAQEIMARQQERRLAYRGLSAAYINGALLAEFHRPQPLHIQLSGAFGWFYARMANKEQILASLSELFSERHRPDQAALNQFWPSLIGVNGRGALARRAQYLKERAEQSHRLSGAVKGATVPQALIVGLDDPTTSLHSVDALARRAPSLKVQKLLGLGHYPQIEAPETLVEALIKFYRQAGILAEQPMT